MIYLELYKEQLENNAVENILYRSDIVKEYFALNCFLNNFERTDERLTEIICEDIEILTEDSLLTIEKSVSIIKDNVELLIKEGNPLFTDYKIDGIVLLLGDSTVDSQGIMVNDKTYLVIDLLAYSVAIDKYNPISFLVHDITHSIHYKLMSDMYFKNYSSQTERVLKRMVVEGLATYITKQLTDESDEDVFWLGYLDDRGVEKWKEHAYKVRGKHGNNLRDLISNNIWRDQNQFDLFSISDPDKLWEGRLAYYYGYEIVENLSYGKSLDEVLKLKYSDYYKGITEYFSLVNI